MTDVDELLRAAAPKAVRFLLDVVAGKVQASKAERMRAAKTLLARVPPADILRIVEAQRPGRVAALLACLDAPAELRELADKLHAVGVKPEDLIVEGHVVSVVGKVPHVVDVAHENASTVAACMVLMVRALLADMQERGQ